MISPPHRIPTRFTVSFSPQGVFARAKLRVHYFVPVHVMAVTRNRLKRLDETWRANSYFTHADFRTERVC